MRADRSTFANACLVIAAGLLAAACARPLDMSLASIHQRTPEFDFMLYQDSWACLSQATPGREPGGSACGTLTGRQLRELFAQRSSARSLRAYLTENGASCRSGGNVTTCNYTKVVETPVMFGRRVNSSGDEGLELTVSFPARDTGLAPDQITTALRRFTRTL
jgi:hypothetical protein